MDLTPTLYPASALNLGRRVARYWSVTDQRWVTASEVPSRDLAAMPADEREAILAHLAPNPSEFDAPEEAQRKAQILTADRY